MHNDVVGHGPRLAADAEEDWRMLIAREKSAVYPVALLPGRIGIVQVIKMVQRLSDELRVLGGNRISRLLCPAVRVRRSAVHWRNSTRE
eukprot:scaffold7976_cov296-Pinguiococcus_pyrenoidosus.AAC.2